MNLFERKPLTPGEAQLAYLDAEFKIIRSGTFVRCSVTGEDIPLDELRYWSVDRQEPYGSREAVLERLRMLGQL